MSATKISFIDAVKKYKGPVSMIIKVSITIGVIYLIVILTINAWSTWLYFSSPGRLLYAVRLFSGYHFNYVAWSPDGQYLSTANGDGNVWVLHADGSKAYKYTGRLCSTPPLRSVPNTGCWINTVAWSQ